MEKATKKLHMILKIIGSRAALGFPVRRLGRYLYLDKRAKKLDWLICTDITEWVVWPVEYRSPLHKFLSAVRSEDEFDPDLSISFEACQFTVGLQQFAEDRCYSGFPEYVLRKLLKNIGLTEASQSATEELCALELVRQSKIDLTELDAAQLLLTRAICQQRGDQGVTEIDLDVIENVILESDVEKVKTTLDEQLRILDQWDKAQKNVADTVTKHFERRPMTPKAKQTQKKAVDEYKNEGVKINQSLKNRWYQIAASTHESVCEQVECWLPPRCTIVYDKGEGRYIITYPSEEKGKKIIPIF